MLYVFHVDAGLMTTYDMSLTLQSVSVLKQAIEKKTKIPASSLVLLVSGGEVLQSDHKVSSYSAGTDTNPIYMFSKPSLKDSNFKQSHQYSVCDLSPIVELSSGSDWRSELRSGVEVKSASVAELKSAVEMCCSLPPAVNTIVTCANLAQQFSEFSREFSRCCEHLVHDQHLQHQGWAAVVANLEDIFNEFCERSKNFKESFKKHRLKKDYYHEQLNSLNEVLESLGKIPILPALQLNAEAHRFSAFDVFEETDFEGQYDQISAPMDNSSENKGYPDFGVDAFKLSEEEVFEEPAKQWSENKVSGPSQMEAYRTDLQDSDEGVTFKAHSYENKDEPTLLHWILAQGNKASLQDILDYCQKGLMLIDEDPLKEREAELCSILEYANMHGLKQIKGIEDRLYGLDQLLNEVKKASQTVRRDAPGRRDIVPGASHVNATESSEPQGTLVNAVRILTNIPRLVLKLNRERVSSACDPSVLPTLVRSHRCQLEKLLKNHETMVDIRRRIAKSKDELSHILKARLEAVLMIENSMSVQDAHQMLSFQCFNRLARYFDIVEQLHRAPHMFIHAVHEVARRRTFSDTFLQWAMNLANHLLKIHNEEIVRRQEFNSLFHGHFLKSLFPGTNELPPAFATQAPAIFDGNLPKLEEKDVEFISNMFPELTESVPLYDMEYVVNFFRQRGFESEAETCEFEKLSTENAQKIDTSTTCAPDTVAVSTITEVRGINSLAVIPESPLVGEEFENSDYYIEESLPSSLEWGRDGRQENMDVQKINIEKLKEFLFKLFELCKVNIFLIREQLSKLRSEIDGQNKFIGTNYMEILKAWESSNDEMSIRFREETQRLTVDHELEMSDMKKVVSNKEEEIATLKNEYSKLEDAHQKGYENLELDHQHTKDLLEKAKEEIKSFEKKLEEAEVLKQKEIKDLQEKMHMDYKAEIESLRSRFRLVALTNMDRSPSESSLEKIERTDVIEITSHNAIVMQTKENAEVEKEQAVQEAMEKCEKEWQQKLEQEISNLKAKYEFERQVTINDSVHRIIEEKDRQIEELRERENNLVRECTKYKETIQQLADSDINDYEEIQKRLEAQVATLETEKVTLTQQIQDLKKEVETRNEEDKSREDDTESSTSQRREERVRRGRCHTPWGLPAGTISLSSCLPGHIVLVLWDPSHRNYTVMQESSMMYFVYSECLAALDLSINVRHENERRLYAVAVVESKEYCFAKKSGNRYMMPRGSRFYRVHVRPYRTHVPPPCCEPRHSRPPKEDKEAAARPAECMKRAMLPVFSEPRLAKKWLTFMHAPDMQRSVETIMSASTANDESVKIEVATATLINLESPVGARPPATSPAGASQSDDQPDSIEADANFPRLPISPLNASVLTDMEGSVGRVLGSESLVLPTELTVSALAAVPRDGSVPPDSELAEEATP
ncbi:RB1-inducible coiled-coil protein 1 [Eumeta japonica]|uniref:RB1-inducible coiled-coil protein 1 n=1 Tax=Eumeta variegata TaxID=151549 RepID=A0A4C1UB23_EUMVA|nr:RB1-inducible coiled-coil protein 1 [Eumeta japonica]